MGAARLVRRIATFSQEKSGSVAILFALSSLAMFLLVGLTLDYGRAIGEKSVLNAAADAAALAALAQAQSDYAKNYTISQMATNGQAAAQRAFLANAGSHYANLTQAPTISLTSSGQTINAAVSYQAKSPNLFGGLAHANQTTLTGASAAAMTLPSYMSFYLLLDVSASMGIPSTASEINRLAAINPDDLNNYPGGCTIACHFTAYKACQNAKGATVDCQGYILSRNGGNAQNAPVTYCPTAGTSACIQLRLDAVAYATQQLILTATKTQTLTNQFGIGLYPFIRYMQAYQPLTTTLSSVSTAAAGLTALIDNGNGSGALGSGGTHFENALTSINGVIATVGNGGTSTTPRPFVFLVTDGAQDNQYQNNASWSGSNHATTLDTSNCATIKNRGITLAVLYVPYVPIPNPTSYANNEDYYANANIPQIPTSLQACASPGFYFTASTPTDINAAMQAMFGMAVTSVHLTQ